MIDDVLRLTIIFLCLDALFKLIPLVVAYTKYLIQKYHANRKFSVPNPKLNVHTTGTEKMIISKGYFYTLAVLYRLCLTSALFLNVNFEQKVGYNMSQVLFNGYNIIILVGIKIYSDYYYQKVIKGK